MFFIALFGVLIYTYRSLETGLEVMNCILVNKFKKTSNQQAFTLAEVLITLGIIGVVAALTIPALMKSSNDLRSKTTFKNTYNCFLRLL